MRKLKRSIARYNMELAGIQHPNKRVVAVNPQTGMLERMPSFFAGYWRAYAKRKIAKKGGAVRGDQKKGKALETLLQA